MKMPSISSLLLCSASLLVAAPLTGWAQTSIVVPNGSFESQSAQFSPNGVNLNVDSWTKLPQPTSSQTDQAVGLFYNYPNNPGNTIDNADGFQVAYVFNVPGFGVQQTLTSADGVYQVGNSYNLTVSLTANNAVTSSDSFALTLYYLNGTTPVTIGETDVAGGFSTKTHLFDSQVNIPAVQATDAWAGKAIGIQLSVASGTGSAYWDLDNVRLTSTTTVPEPSTWTLALVGLGGLWLTTRFFRVRR